MGAGAVTDQDYYETLQVSPKADPTVIAAAYRRLALLYHPDRNNSPESTEQMARINVAYEILRDTKKRADYDRERRVAQSSGNQGTRQTGSSYGSGSESQGSGRSNQRTGQTGNSYSRSQYSAGGGRNRQDSRQRQTRHEGSSWSSYSHNGPRPTGSQGDRGKQTG